MNKEGSCKICKKVGYTEWHHIISRNHLIISGQKNLLKNPDNLVELCKRCHNQTTASMVRKRLLKQKQTKKQKKSIIQFGRKFHTRKGKWGSYKYVNDHRVAFVTFARR